MAKSPSEITVCFVDEISNFRTASKGIILVGRGELRNGSFLKAKTARTAREILASRTHLKTKWVQKKIISSETSGNDIDSPSSYEVVVYWDENILLLKQFYVQRHKAIWKRIKQSRRAPKGMKSAISTRYNAASSIFIQTQWNFAMWRHFSRYRYWPFEIFDFYYFGGKMALWTCQQIFKFINTQIWWMYWIKHLKIKL